MQKKPKIFIILLLCTVALSLYFAFLLGWNQFRPTATTPREFRSQTFVSEGRYRNDSVEIVSLLRRQLALHEDFFNNSAYYKSTFLIIDTILYSPDLSKLAAFIIVKNPTKRQVMPDREHAWYYDATCYLGVIGKDTIALSWLGPNFTNAFDEKAISNSIRDACLRRFASKKGDTTAESMYNLDDIRFWHAPIWRKIEEERIRRLEFEKTKAERPQDIYIPTR